MGKVKNPAKRESKGRTTPLTPNQKPTTARGRRRSENTDEYQQNFADRQRQSAPSVKGGRGNPKLPNKGPCKRPKGVGSESWRRYMSGESTSL